jgi:hypothetical protein
MEHEHSMSKTIVPSATEREVNGHGLTAMHSSRKIRNWLSAVQKIIPFLAFSRENFPLA